MKEKQLHKYNTDVQTDECGQYVDFIVPGAAMVYDILEMRLSIYDKVDDMRLYIAEQGEVIIEN